MCEGREKVVFRCATNLLPRILHHNYIMVAKRKKYSNGTIMVLFSYYFRTFIIIRRLLSSMINISHPVIQKITMILLFSYREFTIFIFTKKKGSPHTSGVILIVNFCHCNSIIFFSPDPNDRPQKTWLFFSSAPND